ncbi:ABC transporter substrate-binding protein [Pollutimonas sp. H1-120]|uniref:ABC transporter substrate-binding protein n=1 Tax=Pollutimonas sp. H1-120 TaxID=3148824 RepID=UPI003B51F37E
MKKLSITLACGDYDRVQAIRDGRVLIEGCDLNFMTMGPEELFFRAYRNEEFDVCELSLSSYILNLSRGVEMPYVAIPVFISRTFRHSAIYIRTDCGIDSPEDLKGKRVGVPEYQITAALWARALLSQDYGVEPWDFEWFQGGLEQPGRVEKLALNLPPTIQVSSISSDATLDSWLREGKLDALIAMRPPRCFTEGVPMVKRLFPDYQAAEATYFARTGIFPIMHVIGIRRDLVHAHPWLASSVYTAFIKAKEIAVTALENIAALPITFPWLGPWMEQTRSQMGADYWPYGVAENQKALSAVVQYAHKHGTAERLLKIEELFAPGTLERHKV